MNAFKTVPREFFRVVSMETVVLLVEETSQYYISKLDRLLVKAVCLSW